jgi:hypothetical protein
MHQNQDTGHQQRPKVVLTGHLNGQLQGRSVTIRAAGNMIRLELESLISLWHLYRLRGTLRPLVRLFSTSGGQSEIFYGKFCLFKNTGNFG